ncbi:TPA: BspA family leucine-rich repeat surface protein, partial [Enterococcus faecium]
MFYNCSGLTSLDISNWDVRNATSFSSMFYDCSRLKSLDVSNWNVSNALSISSMFRNCSELTSLDVSNWNMDKLQYSAMSYTFAGCSNLKFLDLSNFDISLVPSYGISKTFKDIPNLLVIANDEKLLNYDYATDGVSPLSTPVFDANGGQFEDRTNTKPYFTKVAYASKEKINEVSTFEQFQKDNVPTKLGAKFKSWKLIEGNDSGAQNVYPDLYGTKYKAQWAENMGAPVTVKYVFEDTGKEIASSKTIEGEVGESYDATT